MSLHPILYAKIWNRNTRVAYARAETVLRLVRETETRARSVYGSLMGKLEDRWRDVTQEVVRLMAEHASKFITPISKVLSDDYGELLGTGSYVQLRGRPYLLTNEHVARYRDKYALAHLPNPDDFFQRVVRPFQAQGIPVDAAIARIHDEIMGRAIQLPIPSSRFARKHEPVTDELLFMVGYPGKRARFSALAGALATTAVPYLTQQVRQESVTSAEHFRLNYNPERAWSVSRRGSFLPEPPGFSGSLVWDTGYVRKRGQDWSPADATVTGLVFGWPRSHQSDSLIATRIEVVRSFLIRALREEAAYFHWLERGKPRRDDLTDWLWAEGLITEID